MNAVVQEAAAALRERVAAVVLADGDPGMPLKGIAKALGFETWGYGGAYMAAADRERLKRALARLEADRRVYRRPNGLWGPYDRAGHIAALKVRATDQATRANYFSRLARRADAMALEAWRQAEALERSEA